MSRINLENPRIEDPIIVNGLRFGVQQMANANATLTQDMGPILAITGTASRTFTLPAATQALKGLTYIVVNGAAFTVIVNNASAAAVATVPATVGAVGIFVCLGDTTLGVGGWSGGL